MGRSKYLSPVYASLQDSGQHDLGCEWFDDNKDFYHPVAATTVSGILGPCDSSFTWTRELSNIYDKIAHNMAEFLN